MKITVQKYRRRLLIDLQADTEEECKAIQKILRSIKRGRAKTDALGVYLEVGAIYCNGARIDGTTSPKLIAKPTRKGRPWVSGIGLNERKNP